MNAKRALAVDLLMVHTDSTVAEMLGVRPRTVARWMQDPEFARRVRDKEREQKKCLARVSRQAAVEAAVSLCRIASDQKPDPKVLLDILKSSGAFEPEASDPGEALAEVIRQAAQEVREEVQDEIAEL